MSRADYTPLGSAKSCSGIAIPFFRQHLNAPQYHSTWPPQTPHQWLANTTT